MEKKGTILIVDDDETVRHQVKRIFSAEYDIIEAATAEEANRIVRHGAGDIRLIILDYLLSDKGRLTETGLDLFRGWVKDCPMLPPVIMMTAYPTTNLAAEFSHNYSGIAFAEKPVRPEVLKALVEDSIQRSGREMEWRNRQCYELIRMKVGGRIKDILQSMSPAVERIEPLPLRDEIQRGLDRIAGLLK
ncbi:MAG: response regulator [Nitrospinota bacterium]|nr:response regulator [Nitrospinota bacterium]